MPDPSRELMEEFGEVHEAYRGRFGETFSSMGLGGRTDAIRTAIREMKAALADERGPVLNDELGMDVPKDAQI